MWWFFVARIFGGRTAVRGCMLCRRCRGLTVAVCGGGGGGGGCGAPGVVLLQETKRTRVPIRGELEIPQLYGGFLPDIFAA